MRKCPICDVENPVVRTKLDRDEYTVCQQCGLLYTYGEPEDFTEYYDMGRDGNKSYQADYLGDEKTNKRNRQLADKMNSMCSFSGKRVLEIGSSGGALIGRVKELGASSILGIEISKEASQYANEHGINTLCGNFEDIGIHGIFDVIVMAHVIEHFVRPVEALAKIRSLLTSNGVLISQHPDASVFPGVKFHVAGKHIYREHLQIFDAQTILRAACGFERVIYEQEEPGQSISLFKVVPDGI